VDFIMPKVNKEQIQKINGKCKNNWKLDIQYLTFHNEKQLYKIIELDQEHYLQFELSYNWGNQIVLRISKYYHKQGDTFATSNGLGKRRILSDSQNRKNINMLIEYTSKFADDELLKINSQTEVIQSSIVLASENF